ncbi:hypothetical protein U1Q18_036102, partial [Sarracenia purpurea var. burkii]
VMRTVVENTRVGARQQEDRAMVGMHEFQQLNTPTFAREPDPRVAIDLLEVVTRYLDTFRIVEEDLRVDLAAFQFSVDATEW